MVVPDDNGPRPQPQNDGAHLFRYHLAIGDSGPSAALRTKVLLVPAPMLMCIPAASTLPFLSSSLRGPLAPVRHGALCLCCAIIAEYLLIATIFLCGACQIGEWASSSTALSWTWWTLSWRLAYCKNYQFLWSSLSYTSQCLHEVREWT